MNIIYLYYPHFILIGDYTYLHKWPHLVLTNKVYYQLVNVITVHVFPCSVTTYLKVNTLGVSHVPGLQHKVLFQFIRILKSHPYIHHNIVTTLATLDMVWSCGADVNSWQPTCMHQSTLQMLAAARFTIMPCLWFLERRIYMYEYNVLI